MEKGGKTKKKEKKSALPVTEMSLSILSKETVVSVPSRYDRMSFPYSPWARDCGKKEAILTFSSDGVRRRVLTSLIRMHTHTNRSIAVCPTIPKTSFSKRIRQKSGLL